MIALSISIHGLTGLGIDYGGFGMNGITTISDIKDRCFVNEDGQWIWKYSTNSRGSPICKYQGRATTASRVAYCLANNVQIASIDGLRVWSKTKNSLDVNPANLVLGTPAEANRFFAKKGNPKSSAAGMRRKKMFDAAQIREIRASDKTDDQEAALRGCTKEHIRLIRRNLIYKSTVTNASVFSWRPTA